MISHGALRNRIMNMYRNNAFRGVMLIAALLLWVAPAAAADYFLVGQVTEVRLADRVLVIDGEEHRLGSPVRFTTDRAGGDMVTDLRPGVYVKFNASRDGHRQPITDLRVLSHIPE
jgi:hypothetical protein